MLQNYLKIALRNLLRNKVYSFINILGLAIGVCTCLVIFLLVSFELSFENFQPDRERIYRVVSGFRRDDGSINVDGGLSAPMPASIRQDLTGIESVTACHIWYPRVTIPNSKKDSKNTPKTWKNDNNEVLICEPQYFQIFKYEWLQGNPKNALKSPNEVVLTVGKAEKYFGKIPLEQVMGP
jgi:putative ABC transport system permease protein